MRKNEEGVVTAAVIGAAIIENRQAAGLSQKQLAAKAGVSHAAVSYWENGVNVPNVADCWRVADALGLTVDELIGRSYDAPRS